MEAAPGAAFFDGRTADRKSVDVEPGLSRVRILSYPDGEVLAEWPYEAIEVRMQPAAGRPGQFACRDRPDAVLSINNFQIAKSLAGRAARQAGPRRLRASFVSVAAATTAAIALVGSAYLAWTPLLDLAASAIPPSWERRLGRSAMATLAPPASVCHGEDGQAALDRLAARLATGVGPGAEFHVWVSRGKTVNAFAMPGGFIVLLSGLIDQAASADEVAGVLAHEMAHVAERHSVRLMLRHYGLTLLGSMLMGDSRLSGAASAFGLMAYSREFESQADARAIDILKRGGIRGGGLASFFARMEKTQDAEPGVLRYLSSHPPPAERKDLAQHAAGAGAPAMSEREWNSLRAICKES